MSHSLNITLSECRTKDIDWLFLEKDAYARGYKKICGVDEAGRGPLAGPVFAAAVVFPFGVKINDLNDSKKLSAKKREQLCKIIEQKAETFAVECATVKEILELNILGATLLAMRRAVLALSFVPDIVLVDGVQLPKLAVPAEAFVNGDRLSHSIAAASILAKVYRDRLMNDLDTQYPEYGFAKHKGYGTAQHFAALKKYGPCPEHRKLFLRKFENTLAAGGISWRNL